MKIGRGTRIEMISGRKQGFAIRRIRKTSIVNTDRVWWVALDGGGLRVVNEGDFNVVSGMVDEQKKQFKKVEQELFPTEEYINEITGAYAP